MQKNERKTLRHSILLQRSQLTVREQQYASRLISRHIAKSLFFLSSKRIALYFATRKEIDVTLLLHQSLARGKTCYFPIIHPTTHNKMWFGQYRHGDYLKENKYGIPEPDLLIAPKAAPWSLDLVVVPLVGFDMKGNRLGMGKGYYDRTFQFLRDRLHRKPKLIGVAYDFQRQLEIPAAPWDIPLDMVVTDKEVYTFGDSLPHF